MSDITGVTVDSADVMSLRVCVFHRRFGYIGRRRHTHGVSTG